MSSTVAELRVKRDRLKSEHTASTAAERESLRDRITDLLKQRRRIEARLKLAADLPVDQCPEELKPIAAEIEKLRAERAPHLRPAGLAQVQADLRAAVAKEDAARKAEIAADLKLGKLDDEALDQLGRSLLAQRSVLVVQGEAVQAEVSRRNVEKARRERFKGMTREQKQAELAALRKDLGEE